MNRLVQLRIRSGYVLPWTIKDRRAIPTISKGLQESQLREIRFDVKAQDTAESVDTICTGSTDEQPSESAAYTGESLPVSCPDTIWLAYWHLWSEEAPNYTLLRDLMADMQTADRQDLRQDVALRLWRTSVSNRLRGGKGGISGRAVKTEVLRWIERNAKHLAPKDVATASPDELAKARELRAEARHAEVLKEQQRQLTIEQAAWHKAHPPKAIVFTW